MRLEISSGPLLRVLRSVWIASLVDGQYGPPDEKCGLLLGRDHRVTRIDQTANVALDTFTTFEIDPVALIAAHRRARRKGGLQILGYFHTHPKGPPIPSERDAAMAAADGMFWLIAARDGALLWQAVENGSHLGRFNPVRFDLRIGSRVEVDQAGVKLR